MEGAGRYAVRSGWRAEDVHAGRKEAGALIYCFEKCDDCFWRRARLVFFVAWLGGTHTIFIYQAVCDGPEIICRQAVSWKADHFLCYGLELGLLCQKSLWGWWVPGRSGIRWGLARQLNPQCSEDFAASGAGLFAGRVYMAAFLSGAMAARAFFPDEHSKISTSLP